MPTVNREPAPRAAIRDAVPAVLLAALAFVPLLAVRGTEMGDLPARPIDALAVLAVLAQSLPLAVRRIWPLVCFALVSAGFAVQELRGYHTFASVGLLLAIYSAGAYIDRHRRVVACTAVALFAVLSSSLIALGSPNRPQDHALFLVCIGALWGAGSWVRSSREAEKERRRLTAEAARADERAAIAREMHDVVTHHVTAMVVQADAAQFLPDPAHNLVSISATGRRALGDLRDLLGVLDPARGKPAGRESSSAPTLKQITDLVETTRAAGQPIELAESGDARELGTGREVAAYRVVQEALTNALKYAPGRQTLVRVEHRLSGLDIEVTTAGAGGVASRPPVGGSGRGLAGLRERVEIFGGTLEAAPHPQGGFTVRAHIPSGHALGSPASPPSRVEDDASDGTSSAGAHVRDAAEHGDPGGRAGGAGDGERGPAGGSVAGDGVAESAVRSGGMA